ncbi:MAG TPA: 4'-phosphopantetheinyl transferase superfamily protein [Porticoccaceae bacterium]|nr:4'-phosphopantetheinyl transferase superfamily protein [Gammaproteobacteria bacterium]HIL60500.1 4'-phosphopantetheinyl transferase superfamily protein [Porticoccaceae bacterium]
MSVNRGKCRLNNYMRILPTEIHLWTANDKDFDHQELRDCCGTWLTEAEQARYQRYYFDRHKKQFLLGCYLIRSVLSEYDVVDPQQWKFQKNEYGKPRIVDSQNSKSLFFNLSHSGEKQVLAVCLSDSVGVDIEQSDKRRRIAKIANRFFASEEVIDLLSLIDSEQLSRFYDLWTLKEAYIKACGLGLAIPLQHFIYSFPNETGIALSFADERDDDVRNWQMWQIACSGNYKLALAIKREPENKIISLSAWNLNGLENYSAQNLRLLRRS